MLYVSCYIYKPLYSRKYSFPSFWNNPSILYPLMTFSPWLNEYSIWIRFPAESTRESHCCTYWSHCSASNDVRSFDIHTRIESRESQDQVVLGMHSNSSRFNDLQCGVVFGTQSTNDGFSEPLKDIIILWVQWLHTRLRLIILSQHCTESKNNDQNNGFQK